MRGKADTGLVLFKRHSDSNCPTHAIRLKAAVKRYYWECPCPILIQGRLPNGERVLRSSTGTNQIRQAEAVREALIVERTHSSQQHAAHGYTIAECIEAYLGSRADELSPKTTGQTKLLLSRLLRFAESRNVAHMQGLTVDLLERFKVDGLPDLMSTSRSTAVAKLRRFLREAYRRDWIKAPLVDKVRPGRAVYEQKQPYTDEEVEKILAEAGEWHQWVGRAAEGRGYAKQPETFRLLLELMLETGMRVGDAIRFDPAALEKGEVFWVYSYYPQKQKRADRRKMAEAYVSDRLWRAISAAVWMTPGQYPFLYSPASMAGRIADRAGSILGQGGISNGGKTASDLNPAYLANQVYERMRAIGSRCGVLDCRPHRLRDTFAVRCLLRGMTLEDVSRLLGHSSIRVTETYYAAWVGARKRRLERLLAKSLVNS